MENQEQKTWKVVMALLVAIAFITLSNALVVLTFSLNQLKGSEQPSLKTSVVSGTNIGEYPSAPTKKLRTSTTSKGTAALVGNLDDIFGEMSSQVKLDEQMLAKIQETSKDALEDTLFSEEKAEKIEYIDALITLVNEKIQHLNETCFEKQGLCLYASPNHIYMNDFYGNIKEVLEEIRDAYEMIQVDEDTCSLTETLSENEYVSGVKVTTCSEEEATESLKKIDENVVNALNEKLRPQLLGQGVSIQVNTGLTYLETIRDFTKASILSGIPTIEKTLAAIRDKVMRELEEATNPTIEALEAEVEQINTEINLLEGKKLTRQLKGKSTADIDAAIAALQVEKTEIESQIAAEKEKIQKFYNETILPILDLNDNMLANEVKAKIEGAIGNIEASIAKLEPYSVIEGGDHEEYPEADEAYIQGLQAALKDVSELLPDSLKNLKEGVYSFYNGESTMISTDLGGIGKGGIYTIGDSDPDLVFYMEALVNALESNRELWSDPEGGILGIGTWDGEIMVINGAIDTVIKPLFDQIFKVFDAIDAALEPLEQKVNEFINDFYAFVDALEKAADALAEGLGEAVDTFKEVVVDFLETLLKVAEEQAALQEAASGPVVIPSL